MSTTHTTHGAQASRVAVRELSLASLAGSGWFVGIVSLTLDPPRKPYEETNDKWSPSTLTSLAFLCELYQR